MMHLIFQHVEIETVQKKISTFPENSFLLKSAYCSYHYGTGDAAGVGVAVGLAVSSGYLSGSGS